MNDQLGSVAKGKGFKTRVCRRSGVRPLPPAYYFSHNFFADPVVPFQTPSLYASNSSPLDHSLPRSYASNEAPHDGHSWHNHTGSSTALGQQDWALDEIQQGTLQFAISYQAQFNSF